LDPFLIPAEELENRRIRAKEFLERQAAKSIAASIKKTATEAYTVGQEVLVRRPPSKKFSKGLNNWVAVGKIEEIFERFFYRITLLGHPTGEIKGVNLKRIHHR